MTRYVNLNGRHYRKVEGVWEQFTRITDVEGETLFTIAGQHLIDALDEIVRLLEVIGTYDLALQRATWRDD